MVSAYSEPHLSADERYEKSLSYGLIIGPALLSLLVCGLRIYTRARADRFERDDIAACIALFITQSFNALGIAVVYYGEGRHFQHVSMADKKTWLKLYYGAMCMYLYASLAVKMSLLLFLRRIFVKAWLNRLTTCLMVFQILFSISGSLVLAFQCDPARGAFDLTVTNAKCYSQFKLFQIVLYQAVIIFVCDLIMLIAPMPILWQLHLPTRQMMALMVIFGAGIIACIAPLVRFSTLNYLRHGTTDLTYDSASSLYWMTIEFNLGLVAGSLSSLKPLAFVHYFMGSTIMTYKRSTGDLDIENSHELSGIKQKSESNQLRVSVAMAREGGNASQESIIPRL